MTPDMFEAVDHKTRMMALRPGLIIGHWAVGPLDCDDVAVGHRGQYLGSLAEYPVAVYAIRSSSLIPLRSERTALIVADSLSLYGPEPSVVFLAGHLSLGQWLGPELIAWLRATALADRSGRDDNVVSYRQWSRTHGQ